MGARPAGLAGGSPLTNLKISKRALNCRYREPTEDASGAHPQRFGRGPAAAEDRDLEQKPAADGSVLLPYACSQPARLGRWPDEVLCFFREKSRKSRDRGRPRPQPVTHGFAREIQFAHLASCEAFQQAGGDARAPDSASHKGLPLLAFPDLWSPAPHRQPFSSTCRISLSSAMRAAALQAGGPGGVTGVCGRAALDLSGRRSPQACWPDWAARCWSGGSGSSGSPEAGAVLAAVAGRPCCGLVDAARPAPFRHRLERRPDGAWRWASLTWRDAAIGRSDELLFGSILLISGADLLWMLAADLVLLGVMIVAITAFCDRLNAEWPRARRVHAPGMSDFM